MRSALTSKLLGVGFGVLALSASALPFAASATKAPAGPESHQAAPLAPPADKPPANKLTDFPACC
ncbi:MULTISPECIES: hypothetical protein [Kitasatospora]|uniref:Uncharacterized protein n=1 Tax=Kitasatospora cathayae TaxID=3004092 RepID=A0ABY7QEM6_9ACTN|nr:hypothetical protein [Kitasatospora sp. HUAS 3-15]WBP91186.1 hypothetical protein O1G21_38450 [Kitasatospora sp. HUAS 3-15]